MHSRAPSDPLRVCAIACTHAERLDVAGVMERVLLMYRAGVFPMTVTEKYAWLNHVEQLR